MSRCRLTKTVVDAASPRCKGDLYIWDFGSGAVSGFGLKVTPKGSKIFCFQFRGPNLRHDRRYRIGKFGDWTVDQARQRARTLRQMVDAGVDPIEHEKAIARAAEQERLEAADRAFNYVADMWFEEYRSEPRSRGTRQGQLRSENTLRMVRPAIRRMKEEFGNRRIDEIDELSIEQAIKSIPANQLATRKNLFSTARILWKWAHRRRLVAEDPFARLEAPAAPPARDRVLTDVELAVVWRATRKLEYPWAPFYRLLVLTGQRLTEVAAMTWSELDRMDAMWRIEAGRTKNGLPNLVPLSKAAMAELDAMIPHRSWPSDGLVFSTNGISPVAGFSSAKRQLDVAIDQIALEEGLRSLAHWRVHDLRRTMATGFQRLGVRLEVTEAALNHTSGSRSGIAGVYQRYDFASEKRAAFDDWSGHVQSLVRPRAVELNQFHIEGG